MFSNHRKLTLSLQGKPELILAGKDNGAFDSYSIAFPSLFKDGNEIFVYFTGSPDKNWNFASIGVAWSKDGKSFTKAADSILNAQSSSDFAQEAVTPSVTKIGSKYFMVLSGRKRRFNRRVIGIATSDNPRGPFSFIKILRTPSYSWEGFSIDNGTTLVKEDANTFIVYYSNCALSLGDLILRKTLRRCIGLLRVKIGGVTSDSIKTEYLSSNPAISLRGRLGDWNESTFCPGYFSNDKYNILFFAASKYSQKLAYQSIGCVFVDSLLIRNIIGQPQKIIDQKAFDLNPGTILAFDSPAPIDIGHNILLFYSIMDRRTNRWQVMKSSIRLPV